VGGVAWEVAGSHTIGGESRVEQRIVNFAEETQVASFSFVQFDGEIGGRHTAVVRATVVAAGVVAAGVAAAGVAVAGVAVAFAVVVVDAETFAVVAVLGDWRVGTETALAS
jgi:hypothetical protein